MQIPKVLVWVIAIVSLIGAFFAGVATTTVFSARSSFVTRAVTMRGDFAPAMPFGNGMHGLPNSRMMPGYGRGYDANPGYDRGNRMMPGYNRGYGANPGYDRGNRMMPGNRGGSITPRDNQRNQMMPGNRGVPMMPGWNGRR
ncbi:MAG: hypothetical protein HY868_24715 [Chloroflexi bacterium]|nr:hypothetical protein [Chloroflexota bacterium]